MTGSICGVNCAACNWNQTCKGCAATNGHPFGGSCMVADCIASGGDALCRRKKALIAAFNALTIAGMDEVTALHALPGALINLTYQLPGGTCVKFWDDRRIYLGNQLPKQNSDRCFGLIADEQYLMVSEYSGYGENAEIIVFQRWR